MCFKKGFLLSVMVFCGLFSIIHIASAEVKIEKVVATGSGLSEDKAIQNASKAAIQQVVGMYVVSDTIMKNNELIKDKVLSQSNAYIKSFKVLNKSTDEDGLFEIEAKVEVEVGKLTNKLGELNIAVKEVATEDFIAVSLDKFDSSEDFKAMADRVMFQPLRENKKVYDIKIKSFEPLDDYRKNDIEWLYPSDKSKEAADLGEIKPFRIIFHITLNNDYINSVTQFLEKSSKQVFDFFNEGKNNVYLTEMFAGKENGRLGNKVLKTYELTTSNYNIYKILHLKHCGTNQPVFLISLLGNDSSSVVQISYYFNALSSDFGLSSPQTLNMSKFLIKPLNSEEWTEIYNNTSIGTTSNMITGLDDSTGRGSSDHPEGFFKNTQDLSFIIFLNKDDVKKIKSLKLELLWLDKK